MAQEQQTMLGKMKPVFREDFGEIAPLVADNDGVLAPNPYLVYTTNYDFTFDENAGSSSIVVPANQSIRRIMSTDRRGVVDIRRIYGRATSSDLLLSIYDNEYNRFLMNRPVHFRNIAGSAINPFLLPIPMVIHQSQSIVFDITDLSGADNTLELALKGRRYYFDAFKEVFDRASNASRLSRPYFYTTDDAVDLQIGTQIQSAYVTIVNDADFYLYDIKGYSEGDFRVKTTSLSTGIAWQNGWIHSANFMGQGNEAPYFEPMIIERRTQLKFDFVNLSAATNKIWLTLVGAHYYYPR